MVGIVLVSHSPTLARGVLELVEQMVRGRAQIALAAGIDSPGNVIGTDPILVLAAINQVYSDDGVLVLMDLGSALMSAEAAIELLPEERRQHVYLCDGPLVEGAVAAAAQAMSGAPIARVYAEAQQALSAKIDQLAPLLKPAAAPADDNGPAPTAPPLTLTVQVPNQLGMHARPVARLVTVVNRFAAHVEVTARGRTVRANSMNRVATLGARLGDTLTFKATGAEAAEALVAIKALAEDYFGDPITAAPDSAPTATVAAATPAPVQVLTGMPVSPGVAIAPVVHMRFKLPTVAERRIGDVHEEQRRLKTAIDATRNNLRQLRDDVANRIGPGEAAIFDAHRLMLEDDALQELALREIASQHLNAEAAWQRAVQAVADSYQRLDDPYQAQRGGDVIDIGNRVLRRLMAIDIAGQEISAPSIVFAEDLLPAELAQLDLEQVLGIVTVRGSVNSHSAILARTLGLPAVMGVPATIFGVTPGTVVAVDGEHGQVWLDPAPELVSDMQHRRESWLARQANSRQIAQRTAATRDGKRIGVAANINRLADVAPALLHGAEGIGLFRTEYLYMGRAEPPAEEEQLAVFREIARRLDGRPLVVRTLDVGGDKGLSYLPQQEENNPFLGLRGLRYCLEHPGLFKPQLRAALRAGAEYPVKLMFPMVSALDELILAQALIDEACGELQTEGLPFDDDIQVGIMVEVPAAVLIADHLVRLVDFLSIGTNDLTQYIMAADRTNAALASLTQPFQPPVIRAIQQIVAAAHHHGAWVSVCGEWAGDTRATALLIGLGVDELSMAASAIPQVKRRIRLLDQVQTAAVVQEVLAMDSATAIEAYLQHLDVQMD
jgi:phosphoenolpyruvate-protein phosphotransferase/dihydroxyacetone kinase phosphotransfer subunit